MPLAEAAERGLQHRCVVPDSLGDGGIGDRSRVRVRQLRGAAAGGGGGQHGCGVLQREQLHAAGIGVPVHGVGYLKIDMPAPPSAFVHPSGH